MSIRLSVFFFFSSRRRHTRFDCDWSSDVCSSDLLEGGIGGDPLGNLRVGNPKPQRSRSLIEGGFGDELADDHTVEAAGARLFHADWLAELADRKSVV